jgi:very-short-patch-repair endonuclease
MSRPYSTRRARELRRVSMPAEQRLWERIRDRRLHGLKFRRQQPLHGYIVDFYCAERALVVELDGSVHQDREQQSYDAYRDQVFRERGLTVERITNWEVESSLEGVLVRIAAAAGVEGGLTPPFGHPSPPETGGEGPEAEAVLADHGAEVCKRGD